MKDCTYRQLVQEGSRYLSERGVDAAQHDSLALLLAAAGFEHKDYLVRGFDKVEVETYDKYMELLHQRGDRKPLQLILGEAWFYGRAYYVDGNVLIPRQDTEVLIERVLKVLKDGDSVLDMCTGSGCILLTLACERVLEQAVGVDLSKKALEVARTNTDRLRKQGELRTCDISYVHSDLFTALDGSENRYDIVVSNPPYIRSSVIESLEPEVRSFDPLMALDGYEDGLHFYRGITADAYRYLKAGGYLAFEIGHDQGEAVADMMRAEGYTEVCVYKDLAGLDRVVMGHL